MHACLCIRGFVAITCCLMLNFILIVQQMQMTYLEEWPLTDRDYSSSLSGATEALRASTLRLPVVGGAKVSINISASQKLAHL